MNCAPSRTRRTILALSATKSLLSGIGLAAGLACTGAPRSESPTPARVPNCERGYAVAVTNNADYEVDVFAFTPAGRQLLGTVSARNSARLTVASADSVVWRRPPENPPRFRPLGEVILHLSCN